MTRSRVLPPFVAAAAIIVGALLQSATAVPGLGRTAPEIFTLTAIASGAIVWAQLVALTWASVALGRPAASIRLPALAVWSAIVVIVVAVLLVLLPPAAVLGGLVAVFVLPGASAGVLRAVPEAGRALGRHPWRATILAIGAILALVLLAVAAVAAGLFLTGVLGGVVMWIAFGAAAAVLLTAAARLHAA